MAGDTIFHHLPFAFPADLDHDLAMFSFIVLFNVSEKGYVVVAYSPEEVFLTQGPFYDWSLGGGVQVVLVTRVPYL